MTETKDAEALFSCEIPFNENDFKTLPKTELGLIDDDMPKSVKLSFLNSHKDKLSECFIGAKIKVKDIVNTELSKANVKTFVKILPLRFSIEFTQKSVLIFYINKK